MREKWGKKVECSAAPSAGYTDKMENINNIQFDTIESELKKTFINRGAFSEKFEAESEAELIAKNEISKNIIAAMKPKEFINYHFDIDPTTGLCDTTIPLSCSNADRGKIATFTHNANRKNKIIARLHQKLEAKGKTVSNQTFANP